MTMQQTHARIAERNGHAVAAPAPAAVIPLPTQGALTTRDSSGFAFSPRNFGEAMQIATMLARSALVPQQFRGRPEDVFVAIAMGYELGLGPMAALRGIAVINGRPSVWGDALLAVCRTNPEWEDIKENFASDTKYGLIAKCEVKRKGQSWCVRTFSEADAKAAGLWGKSGPWSQYPKRMLLIRARTFALRDTYADSLMGFTSIEEATDAAGGYEAIDVTPQAQSPQQAEPAPVEMAPTEAQPEPAPSPTRETVQSIRAEIYDALAKLDEEQRAAFWATTPAGFTALDETQGCRVIQPMRDLRAALVEFTSRLTGSPE